MQVAKWGNSLAVRIPKAVAVKLGLKEGDDVDLIAAGDSRFEVGKRDRAAEFIQAIQRFSFELPKDYKFDRDEANER